MTLQDLGSIGELIGAVATVATLAYLALQIRSNSKITRSAALQATLDGGRDHTIQPILNNPGLVGLLRKGMSGIDSLDGDEKARFTWFLVESSLQMQNIMHLYEQGILAKVDYDAWLGYTVAILRTPGAAEVWPQVAAIITPTIRGALQNHLDENPDHPSLLDLMPVMRLEDETDSAV